jgi:5,10-methylene-tetrahydrofolate dehydrogenase/methenyl tetrahydrofolate cyclohydrolase
MTHNPPADRSRISDKLAGLSADPAVHGVSCQSPLPAGVAFGGVGPVTTAQLLDHTIRAARSEGC